jgi:hypothetical protein
MGQLEVSTLHTVENIPIKYDVNKAENKFSLVILCLNFPFVRWVINWISLPFVSNFLEKKQQDTHKEENAIYNRRESFGGLKLRSGGPTYTSLV